MATPMMRLTSPSPSRENTMLRAREPPVPFVLVGEARVDRSDPGVGQRLDVIEVGEHARQVVRVNENLEHAILERPHLLRRVADGVVDAGADEIDLPRPQVEDVNELRRCLGNAFQQAPASAYFFGRLPDRG